MGTRQQAPRQPLRARGGKALVVKYGREHMAEIGRRGAAAAKEKYGPDYISKVARPRGEATLRANGVAHYRRMGQLSGISKRQSGTTTTEAS